MADGSCRFVLERGDDGKVHTYLLDGHGHALNIFLDAPEEDFCPGDIYVGRVCDVVWGIRAAFVELAPGVRGYLPLEEAEHAVYSQKGPSDRIQQGDELVVQIQRPAMRGKNMTLTTAYTLRGRYAVIKCGEGRGGISRKLPQEQREALRELADACQGSGYSCVLRTAAADAPAEEVLREATALRETLDKLLSKAKYRTVYSRLAGEGALWQKRILSFSPAGIEEILSDCRELLSALEGKTMIPLRLYDAGKSGIAMRKLYSLEGELSRALSPRVMMKSGAFLVIEPTEALTVIDVNSGKAITPGKQQKEEALLKVNLEAAGECLRQIRLRNISGIIIVDFINMEKEESRSALMQQLHLLAAKDVVPCRIIEMTALGLVEITRKKEDRPLWEAARENTVTIHSPVEIARHRPA